MQEISAVVIDSDHHSSRQILEILKSFEAGVRLLASADDLQKAMSLIKLSAPSVVILEVKDLDRGVREIESLHSHDANCAVFVVSSELSPQWILRLIRAGAREYLTRPVSGSDLRDALLKISKQQQVKKVDTAKNGKVISVYNPNAGVGTTTIAVNLAAALAGQGQTTAVVDLNFLSRDVGAFLDVSPRYTLESVLPKRGVLDANFLRSIIVPHSSGLHILDGPENLLEANRISPEVLQEVINILRGMYDYTILDTGGQLFGCNMAAFSRCDNILFTTVLSLPVLRNAKRYFSALYDEGLGSGRVKLLINRQSSRDDIKISEAEKILRVETFQVLPNCYSEAKTSINKGIPLVQCYPKSPLTKAVEQLAQQVS